MTTFEEIFNPALASLDPLYNLPDQPVDPFLEDFSGFWMDDDEIMGDAPMTTAAPAESSSTMPPPPPRQVRSLVDLTAADETPSTTNSINNTVTSTDDAVSVVSLEDDDFEEERVAESPLAPTPSYNTSALRKNSSFMNTCLDIDQFMDAAIQMEMQ